MDSPEGNEKGKEIKGIRQERDEWRDEERVRMREVQSELIYFPRVSERGRTLAQGGERE